MQCFDCTLESSRETPACAICHTCGAGLCAEHAVAGYAQRVVHGPGNPVIERLPGRRVYCRACTPAYLRRASETLVVTG